MTIFLCSSIYYYSVIKSSDTVIIHKMQLFKKHRTRTYPFGFCAFKAPCDASGYGPDGDRTRVQKSIPCSSTSVVCYLSFPLRRESRHPCRVSSFILRTMQQSLCTAVSRIFESVSECAGASRRILLPYSGCKC